MPAPPTLPDACWWNTNQVGAGKIGFALSQGAGRSYPAGTNLLLTLGFRAGSVVGPAAVGFGDSPVVRETVDVQARTLTTVHEGASINIEALVGPTIVSQPQDQTVHAGTNVTFAVTTAGSAPLRYQWEWNGTAVPGGTNAELRLTDVTLAQAGDYRVVVSNPGGTATSDAARLVVLPPLTAPSIVQNPDPAALSAGESITFTAQATGSDPLMYQWQRNQVDLPGQTNAMLALTNVTVAQAGSYRVVVRNPIGTATSQAAPLTVSTMPRVVRVGRVNTPAGNLIDLPIELYALGDENTVGFTVAFDPARLDYQGLRRGSAGQGTLLNLNTNALAQGRLGVAMSKPAGQSFAAGTSPLLYLEFVAGGTSGTNNVLLADGPVTREIADVRGRPRPADFVAGYVNILDTPPTILSAPGAAVARVFSTVNLQVNANGSAPLFYQWSLDGQPITGATNPTLTFASVMPAQAGEYQVVVSNAISAVTCAPARLDVHRVVRVGGTNVPTGTTVELPLELLTTGTENSVGFSLRCDPVRVVLESAKLNAGFTNVTLNLRTNIDFPGVLGAALALPPDVAFPVGTQSVMTLRFVATSTPGSVPIAFNDTPVVREMVGTDAKPVPTDFVDGQINTALVPPQIARHPVSREVTQWESAVFAVVASGSLPMSYQWQLNEVDLIGATNTTYSIVSVQPTNAGNYSVRLSNIAGTLTSSNALLTVNVHDTNGPVLADPRFDSFPLVPDQSIANSGTLSVAATDPSGVSRVEFYLDDGQMAADVDAGDGFTASLDLERFTDGPHVLAFRAYDFRNNLTELKVPVVFALVPPEAPIISPTLDGTISGSPLVRIRGNAPVKSRVILYRNNARHGVAMPVSIQGIFENPLTLAEGTNEVAAVAVNRAGESPRSATIRVILDTTPPAGPDGLRATARSGGRVLLEWVSANQSIKGYHVYRAAASFIDQAAAVRLTGEPIRSAAFEDRPPVDGRWYYRVTAVNLANPPAEGYLSNEASVDSDKTPPVATSIEYQPGASYDAATGRFGRGSSPRL